MSRLTNWDKTMVSDYIGGLINRLRSYEPIPVPDSGSSTVADQFLDDATDPALLELIHRLYSVSPESIDTRYQHPVWIGNFRIHVNSSHHNVAERRLPVEHPLYKPLHEWCERKAENVERHKLAFETFNAVVENATTAGQIVRALPFIAVYLPPTVKNKLAGAIRKSRMPKSVSVTREQIEYLHTTLAMCQLLPSSPGSMGRFGWE